MAARWSYNNDIGLGVLPSVLEREGRESDEKSETGVSARPRFPLTVLGTVLPRLFQPLVWL